MAQIPVGCQQVDFRAILHSRVQNLNKTQDSFENAKIRQTVERMKDQRWWGQSQRLSGPWGTMGLVTDSSLHEQAQ